MEWLSLLFLPFQAYGTFLEMDAARSEGFAKQLEAEENAKLAEVAASDAIARGRRDAGLTRIEGSKLIGKQRVAYANSGIDPTEGTPARVMASTRAVSELDALTLENNAAREAWGFRRYGLKYMEQAQLEQTRASNRQTGTLLGGAGRALGGLGAMAGQFRRGDG